MRILIATTKTTAVVCCCNYIKYPYKYAGINDRIKIYQHANFKFCKCLFDLNFKRSSMNMSVNVEVTFM